jgi:hypothetical protein
MGFMAKGVGGGLWEVSWELDGGIGGWGAYDFLGFPAGGAAKVSKGEEGFIFGGGMATTQCLYCGEASVTVRR